MNIEKIKELPEGFSVLETESKIESFNFLVKMRAEWLSGKNRFDKSGEALYASFQSGKLIAIGGVNIDPYVGDASVGRVRHLYVARKYRKTGLGRALVERIIADASLTFGKLRLRTDTAAAASFYEKIGFSTVGDPSATHEWVLKL